MKIHKGDNIVMLNGPDKGKAGKVTKVVPAENTVLVEGLNMVKRHIRGRKQGQKGQVISRERLIDMSRVAIVCKACGKPTRIGFSINGDNKVRICRKCKAEV
ncbi:MAG: 50S ribosomal protein L24 [Patescibacteria group bacterium]